MSRFTKSVCESLPVLDVSANRNTNLPHGYRNMSTLTICCTNTLDMKASLAGSHPFTYLIISAGPKKQYIAMLLMKSPNSTC